MLPYILGLPALWRFRGYNPQPVNLKRLVTWLRQFPPKDRYALISLLNHVEYLTEKQVRQALVDLNTELLERLEADGILPRNVIYMQIHDAGSSSAVILNMLRDAARLQSRGVTLLDSHELRKLNQLTNQLGQGAIIYVDDFAGSGEQFGESQDFVAPYIVGNFSQFFLLPCICEEAIKEVERRGVQYVSARVHAADQRPLAAGSKLISDAARQRLIELGDQIAPFGSLGFNGLATMIVLYSNCPDTVPLVLRGDEGQIRFKGILPRTTDLETP
jgi:hypothetical protein